MYAYFATYFKLLKKKYSILEIQTMYNMDFCFVI